MSWKKRAHQPVQLKASLGDVERLQKDRFHRAAQRSGQHLLRHILVENKKM